MKKPQNPMPIVTVVLTALVTLFLFHIYLPQELAPISERLAQLKAESKVAMQTYPDVPDSLIEYIKADRALKDSLSDELDEEALIEAFEGMQVDYASQASDILSERFRIRDVEEMEVDSTIPIADGLKDIVQFWVQIFGRYTKKHVVFYHESDVSVVYSVLDFSESGLASGQLKSFRSQLIKEEKTRLKSVIQNVMAARKDKKKLADLSPEAKRLYHLYDTKAQELELSEKTFLQGLKYRYGFSHRIKKAIQNSGKYMEEIQRIFRERGLPLGLTAIPFVESAFNLNAYSHAGAAGVWQFIRDTGIRYLKIDDYVDERYDPILAAYAAATHLRNEYKLLKSWPMTINAYNTGPGRMLKASRIYGDDMAKIVKNYKGRGYGFDSRNYFPEIMAALHVYQNREKFFGAIDFNEAEEFEYLAMPSSMNLPELADLSGIDLDVLANMNLALRDSVVSGEKRLPKGYLLKIPPAFKQDVLVAMQELYTEVRFATEHKVRRGDSLRRISKIYDIPEKELAAFNKMLPGQSVEKGMMIRLPSRDNDVELSVLDDESEDQLVVPDKLTEPEF